jgi:putative FmdB family regulatory protein
VPIFDYRCRECGQVSEILLRSTDEGTVNCPHCGSSDLERLISASRMIVADSRAPGTTCCGRTERCDTPPCSTGRSCRRDGA